MFFEATLMDERREARREGRAEGRAEGHAEGRAEGRAEMCYEAIDKLIAEDVFDVSKACEVLGVSEKDYYAYKKGSQSAE